jgi:hypothetical protein
MKRRGILVAGGAGAGAAALAVAAGWPGWLRAAFLTPAASGPPPAPSPDQGTPCSTGSAASAPGKPREAGKSAREILAEARAQATTEKKKILVLVIPDGPDWEPGYERGHAFGEFFNHGSNRDLAPLASVVVVCARLGDVHEAFGGAPEGQPLLVLVDPAARPASLRALDAPLPVRPPGAGRSPDSSPAEDRAIDERITLVASLVRQGLGEPPASEIEARAALVRERLVKQRPPGGQWASSSGCGVDYEEGPMDNSGAVDCGMGHVPKRSARFLYFLANKPG